MSKLLDNIKINRIYSSSKRKKLNIPRSSIEQMLLVNNLSGERAKFNYNADLTFINDVRKSRNREELSEKIAKNISRYATYSNNVALNKVIYPLTGNMNASFYKSVPLVVAKSFLSHKYSSKDVDNIYDVFKNDFVSYISSNNKIKNNLMPIIENNVKDYTKQFDTKMLNSFFEKLKSNNVLTYSESQQVEIFVHQVLLPFMTLYSKEDVENRKELIKFEMKNGYFDKYYNAFIKGETIPSMKERDDIFNRERHLSSEQIKLYNEAHVLEERINSLYHEEFKGKLLVALKSAIRENDYSKLEKVYEFYNKVYKKEIIDSLYSPNGKGITVLEDFNKLNNIMVHSFFRNAESILQKYSIDLKQKIIDSRKDGNTSPELTKQEQMIYEGKMEKAQKQLANQVIVDKTFNIDSIYSDANGLNHYKSNTSNQISASILSPLNILQMQSTIGIGFDNKGLPAENIVISSNKYLTTNKGLDNIELSGSKLETASYSLQDMEKSNLNEVVMKRQGDNYNTNASYVFVSITGANEMVDKDNLEKAKKLASDNKLPLIVFNVQKLKKSYEESQSKQIKVSKGR